MPWNTRVLDSQGLIKTEQDSVFTPNNPTDYVPRVKGVAGWGMDSAFGTAKLGETIARIRIQRVTTTSDGSGDGTLRYAMALPASTRTVIVVDTSGWQTLSGKIDLNEGNKTFAFQTAPSPGYYLKGDWIKMDGADNVLFWHLGISNGVAASGTDCVQVKDCDNVAAINCLFWFGSDENFSGFASNPANRNSGLTIYNSIMAHCMNQGTGPGGRGTYWYFYEKATMTRNLIAHNKIRNPRANISPYFDYFNNIIADANGISQMSCLGRLELPGQPEDPHEDNVHHNIWVSGPNTGSAGEALGIFSAGGEDWPGGTVYFPDGQSGRALRNKFIGNYTTLRNDVSATVTDTINSDAVAHGSNVTDITSWNDAETITNILNNCGARPADELGYQAQLKSEIVAMEAQTSGQGDWADTDRTDIYVGDGSGYDSLTSQSKDNFDDMDKAGVFDNATLIDSGTNYRVYDFPVTSGWTDLDDWLNDVANDAVMNKGWEV